MAKANCGGLLIDGVTIVKDPTTKQIKTDVTAMASATTTVKGVVKQATVQANSTAVDVAGVVTDLNALLAKLKTAGLMANA